MKKLSPIEWVILIAIATITAMIILPGCTVKKKEKVAPKQPELTKFQQEFLGTMTLEEKVVFESCSENLPARVCLMWAAERRVKK